MLGCHPSQDAIVGKWRFIYKDPLLRFMIILVVTGILGRGTTQVIWYTCLQAMFFEMGTTRFAFGVCRCRLRHQRTQVRIIQTCWKEDVLKQLAIFFLFVGKFYQEGYLSLDRTAVTPPLGDLSINRVLACQRRTSKDWRRCCWHWVTARMVEEWGSEVFVLAGVTSHLTQPMANL